MTTNTIASAQSPQHAERDLDAELEEIARGDGPEAAQVRGVLSGQRILEQLGEDAVRAWDAGDHDRARELLAERERVGVLVEVMIATLGQRVAERDRVRACRSTIATAALARYERAEAQVWRGIAPERAQFASRLAEGVALGDALAVVLPAVDRLACRKLRLAHARLDRACRTAAQRRSIRRHSHARRTRRRRSAASRARPTSDGDGDGGPPRPRLEPHASAGGAS